MIIIDEKNHNWSPNGLTVFVVVEPAGENEQVCVNDHLPQPFRQIFIGKSEYTYTGNQNKNIHQEIKISLNSE